MKMSKIPYGSHGSTPTQKRLWKVTSDFVRIRDFIAYKSCISCGRIVQDWSELQGGHYKAWSVCRGYSKFSLKNVFGQCAICNTGFNSNEVGKKFGDAIIRRHGEARLKEIETFSTIPIEKIEDWKCEEMLALLIYRMKPMEYKPEYFYDMIDDVEDYLKEKGLIT